MPTENGATTGTTTRTHYEVLEVEFDASLAEVDACYARALRLVDGSSVGSYLVLDEASLVAAKRELEEAHRVLGNSARRMAYDETIGVSSSTWQSRSTSASSVASTSANAIHDDSSPTPVAAPSKNPSILPSIRILAPMASSATVVEEPADISSLPSRVPPTTSADIRPRTNPRITMLTTRDGSTPVVDDANNVESSATSDLRRDGARSARDSSVAIHESPSSTLVDSSSDSAGGQTGTDDMVRKLSSSTGTTNADEDPIFKLGAEAEINGDLIRRLREGRGISIEKLADVTHIRATYLRAIEDMKWDELPARVFLRGFLTQMARVLRVDAKRLADGYLKFVERFKS